MMRTFRIGLKLPATVDCPLMTTIRQYVQSRVRLARYVAVSWIIVLLIAAITIFPVLASKDGFGWTFIGLLPLVAAYIVIGWWTKCPRCKGSLLPVVFARRSGTHVPSACPRCGVSLDEQMNGAPKV